MESILDQLVYFYYHHDLFQPEPRLPEYEIRNTWQNILNKERVLYTLNEEGKILGYVESWRINYAQLGWILCNNPFDVALHDIVSGNICYVANTTILPEYRFTHVVRDLKTRFFEQNKECEFFVGEARRKKHQPFKVFRRHEFFDKYISRYVQEKKGVS